MRLVKKMLRSAAVRAFLCRLASTYMRFASWTTRWEIVGEEHPRGHWDSGQPFLGCFWHGRMMLVAPTWPREIPVDVLISRHGDGQLISTVIGHLGMGTIEGSTSRGAVTALRGVIRKLRSGRIVAITPDGPRGPRMRAAGEEGSVVTLICDSGDRYADTYFNDAWLAAQGIDIAPHAAMIERALETGEVPAKLFLDEGFRTQPHTA